MNDFLQSNPWLLSLWTWALLAGALALWLMVPRGRASRWQQALGAVLGVVSVGLMAAKMPIIEPIPEAVTFWILASIAVASATAMISMRSPVYSAIWFAMTLLGVSGLFLFQGAQLLAVATIVVYAGAIVVMFLFLIMLAQPQGHEYYDRIGWGSPGALCSALAGAAIVLILTITLAGASSQRQLFHDEVAAVLPGIVGADQEPIWAAENIQSAELRQTAAGDPLVVVAMNKAVDESDRESVEEELRAAIAGLERFADAPPAEFNIHIELPAAGDIRSEHHVASLGGVLFSKYLLAVELAGTLLLVGLVGAVAIVMHGRRQESPPTGRQESPPTGRQESSSTRAQEPPVTGGGA